MLLSIYYIYKTLTCYGCSRKRQCEALNVIYVRMRLDEVVVIGYSKPQICALVAQHGSTSVFRAGGEEIVGVMHFGGIFTNW